MTTLFADRADAGRRLAGKLGAFGPEHPLVLALPRGGVVVGFAVARALGAPLDVLLVRKIGAPDQPEFGLGAVAEGNPPLIELDPALVRLVAPPPGYIAAETKRQIAAIVARRALYRRSPAAIAGRTVIVVDDGIATGGTARAALRALRARGATRIVLAVPVAAPAALEMLRGEADAIITAAPPSHLASVGAHYADFRQVEDDEVVRLLNEAAPPAVEIGGPAGPEPTRYGDWERKGRCFDF